MTENTFVSNVQKLAPELYRTAYLYLGSEEKALDALKRSGRVLIYDAGSTPDVDAAFVAELDRIAPRDFSLAPFDEAARKIERTWGINRLEGLVVSEGRFDAESLDFHERVRQGYRVLAEEEPERFAIIDASQPPEDVVLQCRSAIEFHLRQRGWGLE